LRRFIFGFEVHWRPVVKSSIFGFEIQWRPALRSPINLKLFLKIRHQRNGRKFVPNCQTTLRHVPEVCNLQSRRNKNFKSHTKISCPIGPLLRLTSCYVQSEKQNTVFSVAHQHARILSTLKNKSYLW